jgi:hypothetical protein
MPVPPAALLEPVTANRIDACAGIKPSGFVLKQGASPLSFLKRVVDSIRVIIGNVILEKTAQVGAVENKCVIQEISATTSDAAFRHAILPRACGAYACMRVGLMPVAVRRLASHLGTTTGTSIRVLSECSSPNSGPPTKIGRITDTPPIFCVFSLAPAGRQ